MMGGRHDSIGVKQVIPYVWIRQTAKFMLAGMGAKEIRYELHNALIVEGRYIRPGERSEWTRTFLVNNLMAIWASPTAELVFLRNIALQALQNHPDQELTI